MSDAMREVPASATAFGMLYGRMPRGLLFDPESGGGGDATGDGGEQQTSEPSNPEPASAPSVDWNSDDNPFKKRYADSTRQFQSLQSSLKERGYEGFDDAIADLEEYSKFRSKGLTWDKVSGLFADDGRGQQGKRPEGQAADQSGNVDVLAEVDKRFAERDKQIAQRELDAQQKAAGDGVAKLVGEFAGENASALQRKQVESTLSLLMWQAAVANPIKDGPLKGEPNFEGAVEKAKSEYRQLMAQDKGDEAAEVARAANKPRQTPAAGARSHQGKAENNELSRAEQRRQNVLQMLRERAAKV